MRKSDVMGYSTLPYVTWSRERGGKWHLGRLLRNSFLGLKSSLCLPACAHLLQLSRGRCRVITKGFCTLGLESLGTPLELCVLCQRAWPGSGGGSGI